MTFNNHPTDLRMNHIKQTKDKIRADRQRNRKPRRTFYARLCNQLKTSRLQTPLQKTANRLAKGGL